MLILSRIWHPFTQHALADPPIPVAKAERAYLYTKDGRRIIDAISSWWVNTHGHCHPHIVKAVQEQAAKLDQVIFAGFTHDPAEALTEKLVRVAPPGLEHVFFSDSGSICVEVGLKMAVGFHHHSGKARKRVLALEHGYHGDTFGAMALGARGGFSDVYKDFLFDVTRLPFPGGTLEVLERELVADPEGFAAFVFEPLVLGAGGMLMYSADLLKNMCDLCRRHGVLLIADEVMTGWGRTGTMFACEQAGVTPDILCLSKGLTGGFLPLAATLCTPEIYGAFFAPDRRKTFFHSSSYTANPLACAAAAANLDIWEKEPVLERIRLVAEGHKKHLSRFIGRSDVTGIRQTGTIAALDIVTDKAGYFSGLGPVLYKFFLERGILLRPLGNTVYILPPYCITEDDLKDVYDALREALDFIRKH
ncbi:MAG: adenosylmethionine--8-amino-7-oxononanoate transaminase [Pseudomonadota bacterium]